MSSACEKGLKTHATHDTMVIMIHSGHYIRWLNFKVQTGKRVNYCAF